MHRITKQLLSALLAAFFVAGALPFSALNAFAASAETYTLQNEAVKVVVSGKNGGFSIQTTDGDKLNKDDSNKRLLFHRDDYDTSFTSFELTDTHGSKTQYLFGGDYHYLFGGDTSVKVVQDESGISCTWIVDSIAFSERIELANTGSEQHGTVLISYSVTNGSAVSYSSVKARVLFDTALGDRDSAQYEVMDANGALIDIKNERVLNRNSGDFIPDNFFAYDDPLSPSVTAYSLATKSKPYSLAFGHWNNLASTLFDFTPDTNLTFTNAQNAKYLTADSAMALYFDLGAVSAGGEAAFSTYYGVYSNENVSLEEHVAINTTSPMSLTLNDAKTAYISPIDGAENGKFSIETLLQNYAQSGAKDFERVAVAVFPAEGIVPLDSYGNELGTTPTRLDPYTFTIDAFGVGKSIQTTLYFRAVVPESAAYRKLEIKVYNMPEAAQGKLLQENELGSRSVYLLCPGSDGNIPRLTFSAAEPQTVYYKGNRHLYFSGTNFFLLINKADYTLRLKSADGSHSYEIASENILVDEVGNILDLYLTDEIAPGSYSLEIDFQDAKAPNNVPDPYSAPLVTVNVSTEEVYKTESYAILAIVQHCDDMAKLATQSYYSVQTFQNESQLTNYMKSASTSPAPVELIMALRGEFTVEEQTLVNGKKYPSRFTAVSTKTVDANGKSVVTNPVTINNCIDFEDGSMSVTIKNYGVTSGGNKQEILVDLDGSLYTSVERTSVSKGIACFSSISNGTDHGLFKYNKNGERITPFPDYTISLSWPGVGGVAQSIGGMLFNLTYCKLGIMYDTALTSFTQQQLNGLDTLGYVASYYANMDLGFLIPSNKKKDAYEPSSWQKIKEKLNIYDHDTNVLRYMQATRPYDAALDEENPKETGGQASVMVDDILFGLGKGFVGLNFTTKVTIPGYIDAMPNISGKLSLNTIGAWQFGFEGKCKFTTIEFEARIKVKSYNNIPIPDTLYFYVAGFTPGINVDPFGIIWITGGGGGFENLYDTIFIKSAIPPLRLLLSLQLSVINVLEGRADVSLGLRGFSFMASDIKLKATDIIFLPRAQLTAEWYPEMYLMAGINMSIFECIKGSGYIVANVKLNSYEICVRCTVSVPPVVPLLSGIDIGDVTLGANQDKIWGRVTVFDDLHLGVTYYWGDGGVDFGTGGNTSEPTYPELLSANAVSADTGKATGGLIRPVAVYYDRDADRTLYMVAGTNLKLSATQTITKLNAVKLGAPVQKTAFHAYDAADPALESNAERTQNYVNLHGGSATPRLLQIGMKASYYGIDSADEARWFAQNYNNAEDKGRLIIQDESTGIDADVEKYKLEVYGLTSSDGYNTNVRYDADADMVYFTVSFTGEASYQKRYSVYSSKIGTSPDCPLELSLFDVQALPAMSGVSASVNGSNLNVAYSGSLLNTLDSISFYLVADTGLSHEGINDEGEYLGILDASIPASGGTASFAIPSNLPSGSYYLRAVYSKEGAVNEMLHSTSPISYTNPRMPASLTGVTATPAGDLTFDVALSPASPVADAYLLNVYEDGTDANGNPAKVLTSVNNVVVESRGTMPALKVGGSYIGSDGSAKGLTGGKSYYVGVTPVNYIKNAADEITGSVSAAEKLSALTLLPAPSSVTIHAATSLAPVQVTTREWVASANGQGEEKDVTRDVFASDGFVLTLSASESVSGTLSINGENGYTQQGGSVIVDSSGQVTLSNTLSIPF